jgi:flavin-binding protein dodecin
MRTDKREEARMAEKVFKKITVTGCSQDSYEKAIEAAVEKASESLRGLAWFEVTEFRGGISPDGALEFQATLDVAFKVD